MADVIEFLERMGQDAHLRHAPEAVLEQAMLDNRLSPRARAALTRGDRAEIEAVIGAESNVCCVIYAPEPDGEEKGPRGPKAALTIDDNVCCLIHVPENAEEEPPKSPRSVVGIDEKVCCVVFAPSEGEEESDGDKRQKAA